MLLAPISHVACVCSGGGDGRLRGNEHQQGAGRSSQIPEPDNHGPWDRVGQRHDILGRGAYRIADGDQGLCGRHNRRSTT